MNFKYTIEPFVVNSTFVVTFFQSILKSMNFQSDKKVKYDPKHIISQRKLAPRLGTCENIEDVEAKANHSYTGRDAEMSSSGKKEDKGSKERTMIDTITGTLTPFKGERSLKRPITEITNIEVDTTVKKERVFTQGK